MDNEFIIEDNSILDRLVKVAPIIKQLFPMDCMLLISDTEKIVKL